MTTRISRKDFVRLSVTFGVFSVFGGGSIGLGCSSSNSGDGSSGSSGGAEGGTSGSSGTSGTSGTSGSSGASGTSGTSGSSGSSGSSGTSGTSGTSGSSGTTDSGSDADATVDAGPVCLADKDAAIAANHLAGAHSLSIPAADFDGVADMVYSIQGASLHDHTITITAANFATLRAGGTVMTTSSLGNVHTHGVTITCV